MKSKNIFIAGMLMMLPPAAFAQQHIQKAFEALRNSRIQKEASSKYSIEKNPDTGQMEGLEDTYDFILPGKHDKKLIEDIQKAFRQDEPEAYTVTTGTKGNSEDYVSLAVGDGNNGGVAIGLMKDSKWIYACFLDPKDSLRQHRYAYALEWVETENHILGRIVKTYATTQKYRQGKMKSKTITVNGNTINLSNWENAFPFNDSGKSSETWLTEFNTYKNFFLKKTDGSAANSYATQIYKLCKDATSLEDVEKNMVATEIVKLKQKTKDEFIQQLFDMSIERLRK